MKRKSINTTWRVYTYDVLGNERDGYEVNDKYGHGTIELRLFVEVANKGTPQEFEYASPSDLQIKNALDCKPRIKIETDGDDLSIYATHTATGYPLGEMHCESHESLSPVRARA